MKTAKEILDDKYKNNHQWNIKQHILESMEEYAQQFKSQLEIEQQQNEMLIQELNMLKTKAQKWDDLDIAISKVYFDEDGNEHLNNEGGDLCDIGEITAIAFGFL